MKMSDKSNKQVYLTMRINRDLRKRFRAWLNHNDRTATDVLTDLIQALIGGDDHGNQ